MISKSPKDRGFPPFKWPSYGLSMGVTNHLLGGMILQVWILLLEISSFPFASRIGAGAGSASSKKVERVPTTTTCLDDQLERYKIYVYIYMYEM